MINGKNLPEERYRIGVHSCPLWFLKTWRKRKSESIRGSFCPLSFSRPLGPLTHEKETHRPPTGNLPATVFVRPVAHGVVHSGPASDQQNGRGRV